MRIKKLDIFGFKSFATRETINFDSGVTGVVGPNGCGKSNVVDALRWVMGEQNARHLRGGNMQDIIFCGSEKKAPLGFAEVTLTLENDGHNMPAEYNHFSEIQITRRLYKTGDAEYEINKQKARLKDITDFFLGTGVGSKAYSIIEQGRVNEIVLAKAQDRRVIIEEAAGITKYKARKIAAEKRMDATRHNLLRIVDIKKEIDARVQVLAREKEKLEQINLLKDQLKNLDLHSTTHQYLAFHANLRFLMLNQNQIKETLAQNQIQLTEHHQAFDKLLTEYAEKNDNKRLLEQLSLQHQSSLELLQKELEFSLETINHNRIFIKQLSAQSADMELRKAELSKKALEYETSFKDILELYNATQKDLNELKEQGQTVISHRLEYFTNEKQLQTKLLNEASTAARLQGELHGLNAQDEKRRLDLSMLSKEQSSKENEARDLNERLALLSSELSLGQARNDELKKIINEKDLLIADTAIAIEKEKEKITAINKEKLSYSMRLDSLMEIDKGLEWSDSGVNKLLSSKHKDLIKGILADAITVNPAFESVVEHCLSHMLDAALVKDIAHFKDLAHAISSEKLNTTRFLSLVSKDCPKPKMLNIADLEPLANQINIKNKDFAALGTFFANFFIAKDITTALSHWEQAQNEQAVLLSPSGETFLADGSAVFLGKNKETGILSRKNEINALPLKIEEILKKLSGHELELQKSEQELKAIKEEKEQLLTEAKPLWQGLIRLEETIKQKQNEKARYEAETLKLKQRLLDLNKEFLNTDEKITKIKEAWATALENHKQLEDALNTLKQNQATLDKEYEIYQEKLKTLEIKQAGLVEKKNGLANALSEVKINLTQTEEQKQKFSQQIDEKTKEESLLHEKTKHTEDKIVLLGKEKNETLLKLEKTAEQCSKLEQEKMQSESKLQIFFSKTANLKDALHTAELALSNTKNELTRLCEKISERYKANLEDHLSDFHHRPLDEKAAKKEMTELKLNIDRMGPVNENAKIEYAELKERADFLSLQVVDLEVALNQLEEAIKKINKTTEMRFLEAFNQINQQFALVFPRLFNGGKAELLLTNQEDLLSSGVDIIAKPPGKSISAIELMSGGEKALTAISLIVAIFLIKPSPFCLLDEVDAPLDEANVSRFSQLIKEMSELSQFIVITHNRQTMESADQLYGVTMEEAGTSKIVSVHVKEVFDTLGQKNKNKLDNKEARQMPLIEQN